MFASFTLGLDLLLVVFTLVYLAKLLFQTQEDNSFDMWSKPLQKRSLLNQRIAPKV